MNYVLAAASILGLSFLIAQGLTQVTVRNLDNITFTPQKSFFCHTGIERLCHR